jgi:16S rRNA (cytosine1402-N4)-methyltransferase
MTPNREPVHVPVLPDDVLRFLDPQVGEVWVDCTTGGGGHARLIAERIAPSGRLLGLDQDAAMLALARPRLEGLPANLVQANFEQVEETLRAAGLDRVDGMLADLGFSSDQMNDPARGFSFQADGPLDMRLDPTVGRSAAQLVNVLSEAALADIFYEFGEERHSRRVARRIVERRVKAPFETTADLAQVVRSSVPRSGSLDPATRVFQALRIAVNDELGVLERWLALLPDLVKPGGRVGVISFHSLEDRRVKQAFKASNIWHPLTKKPVEASESEIARNPRSRSAKLRVAKRRGSDSG